MKIKKFNESVGIRYDEAFNMYIKDKKILSSYFINPFGDYSLKPEERVYGSGVVVEGGYKMLHYGGGCSGEDCNTIYIVSPDDKFIASDDW